jgi:hypothetical protein
MRKQIKAVTRMLVPRTSPELQDKITKIQDKALSDKKAVRARVGVTSDATEQAVKDLLDIMDEHEVLTIQKAEAEIEAKVQSDIAAAKADELLRLDTEKSAKILQLRDWLDKV